jgi:hypothetical protein
MSKALTEFFGPAQLTNAAATKYTVPASSLAIIRYIHVSNPTGAAVTFTMSIGADAAATRIYDVLSIPSGSVFDVWCLHPVAAATIIQAFAGVAASLVLTFSGDLITLG